ncbi:hypothetical protein XENOCAPTIV_000067 [Xenoophorus captivus]|uniref:Uncharacterized protein n=1 Tax=Xenoophorus captivus TaxID=1517983 RepID=A0ABV0QYH5_9TELE
MVSGGKEPSQAPANRARLRSAAWRDRRETELTLIAQVQEAELDEKRKMPGLISLITSKRGVLNCLRVDSDILPHQSSLSVDASTPSYLPHAHGPCYSQYASQPFIAGTDYP